MKSTKMLLDTSSVESLEEGIMAEIRSKGYGPGKRILSKRKLARILKTTPTKVHTAITNLVSKDILYTKPGSGTFIRERYNAGLFPDEITIPEGGPSFSYPHSYTKKTLHVVIPVHGDSVQRNMWQLSIDAFRDTYPFLDIDVEFKNDKDIPERFDVTFQGIIDIVNRKNSLVDLSQFIDRNQTDNMSGMCDKLLDTVTENGQIFGLPLLRSPSMISVNSTFFDRCGLDWRNINEPIDLFRVGDLIEEKTEERIHGIKYMGVCYHIAMAGVKFRREENRMYFDKDVIRMFLEDLKPLIRKHHYMSPRDVPLRKYIDKEYAMFAHFWNEYQTLRKFLPGFTPIKLPLVNSGFAYEGLIAGCISDKCENKEDAYNFLAFLAGGEAQKIMTDQAPEWLSVNNNVLQRQKKNSTFPKGSIIYDFDPRAIYSQVDPPTYHEYSVKLYTETSKYFTNLQSLDVTIEKISSL